MPGMICLTSLDLRVNVYLWAVTKRNMVKYELRFKNWNLKSTNWKFKSTSSNLKVQVQIHELRVQIHETLNLWKLR